MNSVLALTRTIIVLTFLWTAAECMLSDEKYRRYTDFVYGIVLVTMVASYVFNFDYEPALEKNYTDMSAYNQSYVKGLYESAAEKTLREKFGDSSIEVTLNDDYSVGGIKCRNEQTYAKIREYLYGQ